VARELNERGIKTAQGKPWTAMQVSRVRARPRAQQPAQKSDEQIAV
jgi:hypothetical protein